MFWKKVVMGAAIFVYIQCNLIGCKLFSFGFWLAKFAQDNIQVKVEERSQCLLGTDKKQDLVSSWGKWINPSNPESSVNI